MKAVAVLFATMLVVAVEAWGQGTFVFNNRIGSRIDARFVLCTDPPGISSVTTNFQVQLFGGLEGTPVDQLQPLDPRGTTFRTGNPPLTDGYLVGVTATVSGVVLDFAAVLVRAFDSPTWETTTYQFEGTYRIYVSTGESSPNLPLGSSPLVLCMIPEPAPTFFCLLGLGSVILLVTRQNRLLLGIALFALSARAHGQGQLLFTNHAPPEVDARVRWGVEPPGFSIYGPGWTIRFLGGPAGTAVGQLQPLDAITEFESDDPSRWGYFKPVLLTVPWVAPGGNVSVLGRMSNPSLQGFTVDLGPFTLPVGGGEMPVPVSNLGRRAIEWCLDCQCDRPYVGFHRLGEKVLIWWSKGALQSASTLEGPWTAVEGWSNPQITPLSTDSSKRFFRAQLDFAPDSVAGRAFSPGWFSFSITASTAPLVPTGAYE
jgi:hypothetical protein